MKAWSGIFCLFLVYKMLCCLCGKFWYVLCIDSVYGCDSSGVLIFIFFPSSPGIRS